jgi:hypothetical protein
VPVILHPVDGDSVHTSCWTPQGSLCRSRTVGAVHLAPGVASSRRKTLAICRQWREDIHGGRSTTPTRNGGKAHARERQA